MFEVSETKSIIDYQNDPDDNFGFTIYFKNLVSNSLTLKTPTVGVDCVQSQEIISTAFGPFFRFLAIAHQSFMITALTFEVARVVFTLKIMAHS